MKATARVDGGRRVGGPTMLSKALKNTAIGVALVCVVLTSGFLRSAPALAGGASDGSSWSVRKTQQPGQHVAFERPPFDMQIRLRPVLSKAVNTLWLRSGERVRIQMNPIPKGQDGHWRLPDTFYRTTVFAVSAWNPHGVLQPEQRTINDARNDALRAAIDALRPAPARVLRCVTEAAHGGDGAIAPLQEEGFALIYDGILHGTEGKRAEYAVAVLARKFGRPYIYRWRPHVFGPDPLRHAAVMQTVLPTGAGMFQLKSEGHAYRVTVEATQKGKSVGRDKGNADLVAEAQREVLHNEMLEAERAKWNQKEKEREHRREVLAKQRAAEQAQEAAEAK